MRRGGGIPCIRIPIQLTSNTQAGQTLERMDEVKHRWLPQVILAQNFEETWEFLYGSIQRMRSTELF